MTRGLPEALGAVKLWLKGRGRGLAVEFVNMDAPDIHTVGVVDFYKPTFPEWTAVWR